MLFMHNNRYLHEIFHEIFCEIFLKYFKNFTMFFSGSILTRLIYFIVKHYLSFIYAYCSSLSLSAGLLVWVACLSTRI